MPAVKPANFFQKKLMAQRGRPRKNPLPDVDLIDVETAGGESLPADGQTIMVENRLNQRWIEPRPVPPAKNVSPIAEITGTEDSEDEGYFSEVETEEPPTNQLDELFSGFESAESVVTVVVYEFPNFERDGNSSMGSAKKIFAGTADLPADVRTQDALLQFVREKYAHPTQPIWHFKLQLRQKGRVGRTSKVLSVRPYSPYHEPVNESTKPAFLPAAPAPPPVDPMSEIEKSLKLVERLKSIMGPPAVAPVVSPAPQTPDQIPLQSAIFRIISEDKELVSKTIERFLPAETPLEAAEAPWWQAVVREAAPAVAPLLVSALGGLLTRFMNPATAGPAANPNTATPAAEPAPPAQQIETTIQPRQVAIPEDLAQAIGAILHGIENGIAVNFTAETIAHLAESKPALGAQLDPLLNNEPAQVLHYISSLSPQAAKICEMPGAEDYIKQLQAEFGDDEPEAA